MTIGDLSGSIESSSDAQRSPFPLSLVNKTTRGCFSPSRQHFGCCDHPGMRMIVAPETDRSRERAVHQLRSIDLLALLS
jgi:hypothetical protein